MKRIISLVLAMVLGSCLAGSFGQTYQGGDYILGGTHEYLPSSTLDVDGTFTFKDSTVDAVQQGTLASTQWVNDNSETAKQNVITVSPVGGNYTSISEAVAATSGSSSSNRYTISVYPGVYYEDVPIVLNSFTSVYGVGGIGSVVIVPNNEGPVFVASARGTIRGLSVSSTTSFTNTGIVMDSAGFLRIDDCVFNGIDTAICVRNAEATVFSRGCFLRSDVGRLGIGYACSAGNLEINSLRIPGEDTIGMVLYVTGASSFVTATSIVTFSPNLDTAVYATDTASVVLNLNSIVNAKNGIKSNNYASVKYNADYHYGIQDTYTDATNGGTLGGFANNDDNDEATVFEGTELHVGDAAQGHEICMGQGDSYSDDVLVYQYNGSVYTDVSDSTRLIDGATATFPNVNVNTALYIASTVSDTLKHYGFKLAMVSAMDVGTGEVVLEYWDGSTWTEFNGMVTDGSAPYAPRAKAYLEQTQSTHVRYDIDMTNDDWSLNDDPGNGTDRKWVRLRIATAITTAPEIDQIKLHSSRFEVNADGFTELFGNARNSQAAALTISQGRAVEGNLTDVTVWSDADIGVAPAENNFNSTDDMLGYVVRLADNLDTSSPLSLVMAGRPTTTETANATIRWRIVAPDQTLYISEPTSSGLEKSLVVPIDFTAGLSSVTTVKLDVSDALPSRVDGASDEVWITIQFTTITGDFALTEVGAEYWTWAEGGHY